MQVIYNKLLPAKGFYAITIIKWIFVRDEFRKLDGTYTYKKMVNHESIHEQQILDFTPVWMPSFLRYFIGSLCFYTLYLLEWLVKLCFFGRKAYNNLCAEQEAYTHERDFNYLTIRQKRA